MDVFRLVTIGRSGRARLLYELNDELGIGPYRERDSFTFTPPARRDRTVPSDAAYVGGRVSAGPHDNATVSSLVNVRAETYEEAAALVEELLANVEERAGGDALFVEWRPEGLDRSVFFRIVGPGTSAPAYGVRRWAGTRTLPVTITLPVAPLAEGLPMTVEEAWQPPTAKAGGRVNLVTNPGAELGVASAVAGANTTVARTTAAGTFDVGTAGYSITRTGSTGTGSFSHGLAGGPDAIPVTPGLSYAARARFKAAATTRNVNVGLRWLDANGATLSTSTGSNASSTSAGFTEATVVAAAPAGAVYAELIVSVLSMAAAEVHYADALLVEQAVAVGTYLDGDVDGFAWQGTPHRSTSVELTESDLAEWTVDAGSAPVIVRNTVDAGGELIVNGTTLTRLRHTGRGYPLRNPTVTVRFRWPTTPGSSFRVEAGKALGAGRNVRAEVYTTDGTNFLLRTAIEDAGGTVLGTGVAFGSAPVAGKEYALRVGVFGRMIAARVGPASDPVAVGLSPLTTDSAELGGANALVDLGGLAAEDVGVTGPGDALVGWRAGDATGAITSVTVEPYALAQAGGVAELDVRDVPGNAPARCEVDVVNSTYGVGHALLAAYPTARRSLIANGDLEDDADGWSNAGSGLLVLTGLVAALSAARASGFHASDPRQYFAISTDAATANQGGGYRTAQSLKVGRPYTVEFDYTTPLGGPWEVSVWAETRSGTDTNLTGWLVIPSSTTPASFAASFASRAHGPGGLMVAFRRTGTASSQARITGLRIYEHGSEPVGVNQRGGRGAHAPVGLLLPEGDDNSSRTNVSLTSATWPAPSSLAVGQVFGGGNTGAMAWLIDPTLVPLGDELDETLELDVYAYIDTSAVGTYGNAILTLSARPHRSGSTSGIIYTPEHGSAGKSIGPPTAGNTNRVIRLGTLVIPRDLKLAGRLLVHLAVTLGGTPAPNASSGIRIGHLTLAPARRSASSPTGKELLTDSNGNVSAGNTYPAFIPQTFGSSSPLIKRIDGERLGGALARLGDRDWQRDTGLGGPPLRLEPGDNTVLVMTTYAGVPDGTVATNRTRSPSFGTQAGASVRVTPRYRLVRPS